MAMSALCLKFDPIDSLQKVGERVRYSSLFLAVGLRNRQVLPLPLCALKDSAVPRFKLKTILAAFVVAARRCSGVGSDPDDGKAARYVDASAVGRGKGIAVTVA
jgi:hypothetical protein